MQRFLLCTGFFFFIEVRWNDWITTVRLGNGLERSVKHLERSVEGH